MAAPYSKFRLPLTPYVNNDKLYHNDPSHDPYTFVRAEDFFNDQLDNATLGKFNTPVTVTVEATKPGDNLTQTGALFRFDAASTSTEAKFVLIQFVRPQMWRIRFDAEAKTPQDYDNDNTKTLIHRTLPQLIEVLDQLEGVYWDVHLDEVAAVVPPQGVSIDSVPPEGQNTHYRLISYVYKNKEDIGDITKGTPEVILLINKAEFKITALRKLKPTELASPSLSPLGDPSVHWLSNQEQATGTGIPITFGPTYKVIWETTSKPLSWRQLADTYATAFSVNKPGPAKYIGFGEQGGQSLLKKSTFMNYFDYDNNAYVGVYGIGPLDQREPLYHSEPFWIELNAHQHVQSKVGTFIDNMSQVCIDFGKTNESRIRTGLRFGKLDYYVMAGNDIPDVIKLYTSIVGRSFLKPRYVLGYHQACYGPQMDHQQGVYDEVTQYRKAGFPLDGIHIDVDIQDHYKTFTTSPDKFPQVAQMFSDLRENYGIKCGTNITPVISYINPGDSYRPYTEGLSKGYFIRDRRKTNQYVYDNQQVMPYVVNAPDVRNISYEGGQNQRINPVFQPGPDIQYDGQFNFQQMFNNGDVYYGGVSYGPSPMGTPGHYPDLFRKEVRDWWGGLYEDLFNKGLEFVWQDMTSPAIAPKYGDMKSFPFRLLVTDDDGNLTNKTAIELWHLYSYQLHKATYRGLNNLKIREGKRNFIIGRGSFAGMQRYAGLWTGDNASSWDFLRISVSQVLAAGLCGIAIAGVDCGGFEPDPSVPGQKWADPELIMRFYSAFFMLPWFRNHYNGKQEYNLDGGQQMLKKLFQEPFKFQDCLAQYPELGPQSWLYNSVLPVCRYFVRLRYTLMQLLYDAMFQNMFTGLPIARSLVITDVNDESLYSDAADYLNREYCVGNDLLIAPTLLQQTDNQGNVNINPSSSNQERFVGPNMVYLPQPDFWYAFNLRHREGNNWVQNYYGDALQPAVPGGTVVKWEGIINYDTTNDNDQDPQHIPYLTAMYIREGGIIPQLDLHYYVPGKDIKDGEQNHINIHVYPGKNNTYSMYLDDGESRNSAPKNVLSSLSQNFSTSTTGGAYCVTSEGDDTAQALGDCEAADQYREVKIEQTWNKSGSRTVTISTGKGDYDWALINKRIGTTYNVVLWHASDVDKNSLANNVSVKISGQDANQPITTLDQNATVVVVPVGADVEITCNWKYLAQ